MMTWLTDITNALVQVMAEFWGLKLKFGQDIYISDLLVLNFEKIFLFSHWF